MKNLLAIISSLFLFTSSTLLASDYQSQIDDFFELYQQGKISESLEALYASNKYISPNQDQIKNLNNQLKSLPGLVGDINEIVKLAEYNVKDVFMHVTYIVIYERQPIRFEFQYFNSQDKWIIFSMLFDDDLDDEIEVLARQHALKNN